MNGVPARIADAPLCALLLGGSGPAAAQDGTDLTKRLGVTGTAKHGKKFTGTYTIDRFVARGDDVFAVGMLKGKLKKPPGPARQRPDAGQRLRGRCGGPELAARLPHPDAHARPAGPQPARPARAAQPGEPAEPAIPGGGLLGDLLCGIANLLNPPALLGNDLAAVLNSLLALVPARPTG